jgi:hypothetical protein
MGTLNEDLDSIKAIEDKLTANKVANFAYTDHAYNNPLTEADGVTNYNVNNEQNIPVADSSIMNVNDTVLTKGWRSQASAITRMLMNHFLGRVSYNLNKLNDNMSALLTTLRANLSNVVNTGDSANVSSGGTTKFTTGGAYNLLSSIAPYFSTSTTYAVGALLTYQNRLYECTTAHSAGAWNASHFTAISVQYVINNYILPSLAPAFSSSTAYVVGDLVIYQNKLYRCTVAHSGAWSTSDFTLVTVGGELALKADKTSLALPTDAVLHYSFDEVPDYPDGTAIEKHIKDFTSVPSGWDTNNKGVLSVANEELINTVTNGTEAWFRRNFASGAISGIIKVKVRANIDCQLYVQYYDSTYKTLASESNAKANQEYTFTVFSPSTQFLLLYAYTPTATDFQVTISEIYIGDGSYSTPIIDNANGQWNGTNYGSIPVQGVSGKAIKSFKNSYKPIKNTNFKKAPPYTFSVWLKFPTELEQGQNIIDGRDGTIGSDEGLVVNQNLSVEVGSSGRQFVTTQAGVIQINAWANIVVVTTVEGNGNRYKVYINGSLIKEEVTTNSNQGFKQLTVNGRLQELQQGQAERELDDFLFFDRALTDDEVTALYLNKANTPKYYGEVPVTRKVNGYTLDKDITLAKSDVGLDNVVNTGDSATPVLDGTTKFTTGGAYTELNKKVDKTTTVNGHALSGNVSVTKADLSLDNVVNTGDSATPVLDGTTKFTTGGAYTELNKKVDKTTTVNGHALSGNVSVTKADLSLDNVVNTGDSATPVLDGTTKFTTGGAYTELNKKFDKTSAGDQVTYSLSGNTLTITSK